jgi:hypothetical protein
VTRHLQTLLSAAHNSSEYKEKEKQYNATIQRLGKAFGCGGRRQTYSFSVSLLLHFCTCCPVTHPFRSYRLPVASLDQEQLFDCMFASTCEGVRVPCC